MPSSRPPRLRRPVVVLCALIVGLLSLLAGGGRAAALPYAVDAAPELTLPSDVTYVLGQPGQTYLIEAEGDPVPAIGVDRLPTGLRLVAHADGSASIAGTPTGPPGTDVVEVRAQNAAGSTVETLTVTIQQAPTFLERGPVVVTVGELASVRLRTAGHPAPSIGLEGDLPVGLTFVDNGDGTATITGTPVDGPSSTPVTLTAVNVVADESLATSVRVIVRPETAAQPVTSSRPQPQREP